jgi:type II secretory ATPase GspE/PulE/Tfp pilus assembly ATPase PilB-like protein
MQLIREFAPKTVAVSIGLVDGETRRGHLQHFDPNDEMLEITSYGKSDTGQIAMSVRSIPMSRIAYVGFVESSAVALEVDTSGMVEYETRVKSGRFVKLHVLADKDQVDDEPGFYAYPVSDQSLFSEFFFFARSVVTAVDKRPVGELLVEEGLINSEQLAEALNVQTDLQNSTVGEILVKEALVAEKDIKKAVTAQKKADEKKRKGKDGSIHLSGRKMRLGEILVEQGVANEIDIEHALEQQGSQRKKRLGEVLVEMGIVSDADVSRTLARKFQLDFVDLDKVAVMEDAPSLVPHNLIEQYHFLPFRYDKNTIDIAFSDPFAMEALEMLQFSIGRHINQMIAAPTQLAAYIQTMIGEAPLADEIKPGEAEDEATIRLVDRMITDAHRMNASDIHLEPDPVQNDLRVRVRIDGACQELRRFSSRQRRPVLTRVKILAELDIAERRKPQDGKIGFRVGDENIELRVATLPLAGNEEAAVLRLLASGGPIPINKLGLTPRNMSGIQEAINRPYGMILSVGPTGSGKTTTLHSLLAVLNTEDRKIWTAEDPVEITQAGLGQMQMNAKIDLTFASAMRAFLRADPDIIMVGEMRDRETASIGIEASLTGHLVFSTLHTNTAPETVTRLLDMGMDPFTFADSLSAVLAQRLARRLCTKCRESYEPSEEEIEGIRKSVGDRAVDEGFGDKTPRLWRAKGCPSCSSGYKGRLGIHELLVTNDAIRAAIQQRAGADELRSLAIENGMRTLLHDGFLKCIKGDTDLSRVLAVCAV